MHRKVTCSLTHSMELHAVLGCHTLSSSVPPDAVPQASCSPPDCEVQLG